LAIIDFPNRLFFQHIAGFESAKLVKVVKESEP